MREENQVNEATTDATEDDKVRTPEMEAAGRAYMEANDMTEDDVQQSLNQMSDALKAMPKSMDTMMMGYFIDNLFNACGVTGAARLELLGLLAEKTDGSNVRVVRLREDSEGNITQVSGMEELLCGCPKCTAEREAENRVH